MHSSYAHFAKPTPAVEKRIDEMLDELSLDEKIDMIGGVTASDEGNTLGVPHAGIPALKMADGPVGVHWWTDASTTYPATIGLAASWDRELSRRMGQGLGRDARARGVHILLGPGVNIYRSPLCGRNFEYMGEDPCLAAAMVVPYIQACQGEGVATTVKHYAANFQEYDRYNVSSDIDERTLREVYLPAFKAAICDGGSACLMTAYNLVNGQHCSEHDRLINEVLKGEWGFDGVVMSDWVSVYSTVGPVNGGLDLEMPRALFMNRAKIHPALANGLVTEHAIDDKVRRLLRVAACFGWLDHEQKDETIPDEDPTTEAVALDIARSGTVLLENRNHFLPFDVEKLSKLALVGYHASTAVIGGGGSSYTPPHRAVSVLDGIRKLVGGEVEILHGVGVDPHREQRAFREARFFTPDGAAGLKAEYMNGDSIQGDPAAVQVDEHIDFDWRGPKPAVTGVDPEAYAVRWTGEIRPEAAGKHLFYLKAVNGRSRLWVDGELKTDSGEAPDNTLRTVAVDIDSVRPVPVRLEYEKSDGPNWVHLGWEPEARIEDDKNAALTAAREADAVVFCTGFTEHSERENLDRPFGLDADTNEMLQRVAAENSQLAVVLHAGGNVDMADWIDDVKGLLHVWYPGQEGGQAVAEILFGEVNPSGKLPVTFEKRLADRSSADCYHDEEGTKRVQLADGVFTGYRHFDRHGIEPRYPFGFGLSYTTFDYENLRLSETPLAPNQNLRVAFDIVNTGHRAGAEVAQVYVADLEAEQPRPVKELKGFAKTMLEPGERKTVVVELDSSAFEYFNPDRGAWGAEPGEFDILVGASSADIRLSERVTLSTTEK